MSLNNKKRIKILKVKNVILVIVGLFLAAASVYVLLAKGGGMEIIMNNLWDSLDNLWERLKNLWESLINLWESLHNLVEEVIMERPVVGVIVYIMVFVALPFSLLGGLLGLLSFIYEKITEKITDICEEIAFKISDIYEGITDIIFKKKREKEEQERRIKEEEERRLRAEEERKKKEAEERNRKKRDELYRQATAKDNVDEDLMRRAADMGCRPACLYIGRQMMEEWWRPGVYTKKEEADIAEKAKRYFYIAFSKKDSMEAQTEARFGYLFFKAVTEDGNASKWEEVLSELRNIQKSGMLPENHNETCVQLIKYVVHLVNTSTSSTSTTSMTWAAEHVSTYSGGGPTGFDADSYVSKNCTSYIYGVVSEDDIKKIENDSSLTSSQKEAAKSELRHKSDMYY